MKRLLIIAVIVVVAGVAGVGALYGRDMLDGMRFEKAMHQIGEAERADAGPWPRPQETCFFCHGPRGQSQNTWYPALSGQPAPYVVAQLHAFATGQRRSPYMAPLAKDLTDAQIDALAAYFAKEAPARNESVRADPTVDKQGLALVQAKSCQACHGSTLMGKDHVPRLAGQGEAYLLSQLAAFKSGERHDPTGAMNGIAATLSGDDIAAVAHYLASLSPGHDSISAR
ncbi:cytochrome C [Burkholderia cepacia]|uniref:c-type cytochrome n=1 Tax=Burkholderia cepacia TaxID=292 RepID=UPI0007522B34|nr:c-type cytochrome [Burkholderia cepacia]KWF82514.1 cytochrome C [Burkholderia cepacia]UQO37838.1 c-type cytochrome [Burkholderia cepacia]UQO52176.1 c-type cytochrome [Burkholderia cepacia]UQP06323.1 c-type cytochrome [Burkholderia cepacia]